MDLGNNYSVQPLQNIPVLQNGVQTVPNGVSNQQLQSPIMQPQGIQGQVSFTPEQQAMINNIVSGRVNEVTAKYLGQITQLQQVAQAYSSTQAELEQFKMNDMLNKSGVQPIFSKFVASEAKALAVNGKTFDVAVSEFLNANPQFRTQTVTGTEQVSNVVPNVNTGMSMQNANIGVQWGTAQQVQQPVANQNMQFQQTQVGAQVVNGQPAQAQQPIQQQVVQQAQQVPQVANIGGVAQTQQVVQNGVVNQPVYNGATGVSNAQVQQVTAQGVQQAQMQSALASKGYKIK